MHPVVQKLIQMVEDNGWHDIFVEGIANAQTVITTEDTY